MNKILLPDRSIVKIWRTKDSWYFKHNDTSYATDTLTECFHELYQNANPRSIQDYVETIVEDQFRRICLKKSMERCMMTELPTPSNEDFVRYSGLVVCELCGNQFYDHPIDYRSGVSCLNINCFGLRMKL